ARDPAGDSRGGRGGSRGGIALGELGARSHSRGVESSSTSSRDRWARSRGGSPTAAAPAPRPRPRGGPRARTTPVGSVPGAEGPRRGKPCPRDGLAGPRGASLGRPFVAAAGRGGPGGSRALAREVVGEREPGREGADRRRRNRPSALGGAMGASAAARGEGEPGP